MTFSAELNERGFEKRGAALLELLFEHQSFVDEWRESPLWAWVSYSLPLVHPRTRRPLSSTSARSEGSILLHLGKPNTWIFNLRLPFATVEPELRALDAAFTRALTRPLFATRFRVVTEHDGVWASRRKVPNLRR